MLSRRELILLPLFGFLPPAVARATGSDQPTRSYEANIGVLFNLLTFTLAGTVAADIDRAAGRYRVRMTGSGPGVTARSESSGIIRGGRFMPTETRSAHTVRG